MEQQIIESYLELKSLTKVAKLYKVDRTRTVRRILIENGYDIINYQNITKFNQHYFDNIDTEEKAYWLGFLYADGAVGLNKNIIELSLKLSDRNHLEKFRQALNCELVVKQDHYRSRFMVTNKHLKKTLISKGCTPRKSYTIIFPNFLPVNLKHHFIRGYFDGDGSIGVYKTKNNTYDKSSLRASLIGTNDFLSRVLLESLVNANIFTVNKNRGGDERVKHFQLSGQKAYNFLTYIYKDATVFLERKYIKYQFAVQSINRLNYYCGIKQGGCDS